MNKTLAGIRNVFFGVLVSSLALLSCTVEQSYHFKKDFSGSYYTKVDFSSMEAFGADASALDTMMKDSDLEEMSEKFRTVPGLSNVTSTYKEHVLFSGFDFSSVNALNSAFASAADSEEGNGGIEEGLFIFTQKKKKMTIKINSSGLDSFGGKDTEGMDEMISFSVKMKFDMPVKKVSSKFAVLDKETNTLNFTFTPKDLSAADADLITTVKF